MEIRPWMLEAVKWGARLYPAMFDGKVYLYELYTTCFVGFESKDVATAFTSWAEKNIDHWGYDPVSLLDTNDEDTRKRWAAYIRPPESTTEKIERGMIGQDNGASVFLLSGYEEKKWAGPTWWLRSPNGGARPVTETEKEIAIIVKDGRVVDVYATWRKDFAVSVVDMDINGDVEKAAKAKAKMSEIKAKFEDGTMFSVLRND